MRWYKAGMAMLLTIGVMVLLYPVISDQWNAKRQSKAVCEYDRSVQELKEEEYLRLLEEAERYNRQLAETGETEMAYEEVLNITESGIMGYIVIPEIHVELPIYHGTSEAVLQKGVGHMKGTSLPIGGNSTHCVLSSHRGLPEARLFTDLDKLELGDQFQIRVLRRTIQYEIDQIQVVEPQDAEALQIVKDRDYCTLVTCTPYGVNSHRMLVRGHCTGIAEEGISGETADERKEASGILRVNLRKPGESLNVYALSHNGAEMPDWLQDAESQEKVKIAEQYVRNNKVSGINIVSDPQGIAEVKQLPYGIYYIQMENPQMQSFLTAIPKDGSSVIQAEPKILDGDSSAESVLPETGILRWPVPVLFVMGCLCIVLGQKKRKKVTGYDE